MTSPINQIRTSFSSTGIQLECVLHIPKGVGPHPAVVVCHPHPLYGGDMDNNVVLAICSNLSSQGIIALRFNYRGFGTNLGAYKDGKVSLTGTEGEIRDALAALEYLDRSTNSDSNRLAIAGYSFGARIALEASLQSPLIQTVALIGCPISSLQESRIYALAKPALFVSGENDHTSPNDKLLQIIEHFCKRPEVLSIQDADHFLWGYETNVADIVARFLKCRLTNTAAG